MSHQRIAFLAFLCLPALGLCQEVRPVKRATYEIRHGAAKDLAVVLNKHFKDEPIFQAVPEPTSNALLLSGPAELLPDVLKVLEKLDRAARQVAVDVWIAEVNPTASKGESLALDSFNGPTLDIKTRLNEAHQKGRISVLRHYELKAREPPDDTHGC